MLDTSLKVTLLALTTASAMQTPCPSQQSALQSSASQWPTPSGDLGIYISSYSSAHNGVFSNCQGLTSGMPTSLSSTYQDWVTSVNDWSTSFESTVSAAASTCIALVANVVIPLPRCAGDAVATGSATSSMASSTSSGSAGMTPLTQSHDAFVLAVLACTGAVGVLAVAL